MKKIKIMLVVEAMLGGVRKHVVDLALGLDSNKFDVFIIYSDDRADQRFFEDIKELENKAHLIKCNEMKREISLRNDIAAYRIVKRHIKEIQPDIVHGHSSKGGIIGRLAAKRCGVKHIYYTPHAYAFQNPNVGTIKKKIIVFAEKFLSRFMTTLTINVSAGELKRALECRLDKENKFTLIYNGIPSIELPDRECIRANEGFAKEAILVGVTARCEDQKDPFTFLKIAKKVIESNEYVEFIYIGNGIMEQDMHKWIAQNHLENKIHMLGFRNDAPYIVGMLDIYLSTALYEGLPYSMIEAMRAGVPIIATDIEGNNELVVDGISGMLFEAQDAEGGAALIMKQIEGQIIQRSNVIKAYGEKFSLETMLRNLADIYKSEIV